MTRTVARWREAEPVRLYLYSVLVPALAVAVGLGLVNAEAALLWGALGAAVLGVPAVERARASVYPAAKVGRLVSASTSGAAQNHGPG